MGALALQGVEDFFDAVSHNRKAGKNPRKPRVNLPLYRVRAGRQKAVQFSGSAVNMAEIDHQQEPAAQKVVPLDTESS
jgi:hypothetical protein